MVKRLVWAFLLSCAFVALVATLAFAGDCCCRKKCEKGVREHKADPHQYIGTRGDMREQDRESYQRMVMMALQGDFDAKLRLHRCQQMRLRRLSDRYTEGTYMLMERYFSDRRMDVDELSHRLTTLYQSTDRHARHQLSPFQDKVFPDCPWMYYSSECWNDGYHPWAAYILKRLKQEKEPFIRFPH